MNKTVLSALLCIAFIAGFTPYQRIAQNPAQPDRIVQLPAAALTDAPRPMPPNPALKDKIKQGVVQVPAVTDESPVWNQLYNTSPNGAVMAPLTGTLRTLVVLVDFSDKARTVTPAYFDTLVYAAPVAGRGSVRDYFHEISYGAIDIVTVNYPSSTGWQRAPQPLSYYLGYPGDFCMGYYPNNCQKLAEDLTAAIDPFVDFSLYDNNKDGLMEPLIIVHAGQGAELTGADTDIWSHSWSMKNVRSYDGVVPKRYVIQPEYWKTVNGATSDMTIGVFAHEMGHGFWGLPDLYDYDYSSEGLGNWSLMAGGSWNGHLSNGTYGFHMGDSPAWPDAWSRIQMGLAVPTYLRTNNASLMIPQVYNNPGTTTVYKLRSSVLGTSEYFLIENRGKVPGTYDEFLDGQGLLIWHVDEAKQDNDLECKQEPNHHCGSAHYLVRLEQADGRFDLEDSSNRGDNGDPFPGVNGNTAWQYYSIPGSSSYYSPYNTLISVTNISSAGETMTANVQVGMDAPGNFTAVAVSDTQTDLTWVDTSLDESGFSLERSVDGEMFTYFCTLPANSTSYSDTSVSSGHHYIYRMRTYRSLDGGTYSPYTRLVSVTGDVYNFNLPILFNKASRLGK